MVTRSNNCRLWRCFAYLDQEEKFCINCIDNEKLGIFQSTSNNFEKKYKIPSPKETKKRNYDDFNTVISQKEVSYKEEIKNTINQPNKRDHSKQKAFKNFKGKLEILELNKEKRELLNLGNQKLKKIYVGCNGKDLPAVMIHFDCIYFINLSKK